jgi:hypothetical protein
MVMTAHIFVVLVLVWLELMFLLGLRIHLSRVFFFSNSSSRCTGEDPQH